MIKRVTTVIVGTNRDLLVSNRRFPSGKLVLNLNTGEMRRGPGTWPNCKPVSSLDFADVTVAAATTADVNISTALVTGEEVDGVTLTAGMLVLAPKQNNQAQNGIYVAGATPARAAAYNTYASHAGIHVKVNAGTVNGGKQLVCTSSTTGTLNSSSIDFAYVHSPLQREIARAIGTGSAGDTLRLLALDTDDSLVVVTGSGLKTYVNA